MSITLPVPVKKKKPGAKERRWLARRDLVVATIERMGARRVNAFYDYELETRAGLLKLHPESAYCREDPYYCLYTRFDDPTRAVEFFCGKGYCRYDGPVNPHSGKWNHLYEPEHTDEQVVEHVEMTLRRVLA